MGETYHLRAVVVLCAGPLVPSCWLRGGVCYGHLEQGAGVSPRKGGEREEGEASAEAVGYIWEVFLRKCHWEESCRRRVFQREVTTGTRGVGGQKSTRHLGRDSQVGQDAWRAGESNRVSCGSVLQDFGEGLLHFANRKDPLDFFF